MSDIITLKTLCEELKIDPREARERLRAAVSDAKTNPELAKGRKSRHAVAVGERVWCTQRSKSGFEKAELNT